MWYVEIFPFIFKKIYKKRKKLSHVFLNVIFKIKKFLFDIFIHWSWTKYFYSWRVQQKIIISYACEMLSSYTSTSVNPVHNAPRRSPHPVLRISHSGWLPPIKTPRTPPPPPPPLHEKNKNHDPPKPLDQKKCTQISSPTLQIPKIPPPSTTAVVARKWT